MGAKVLLFCEKAGLLPSFFYSKTSFRVNMFRNCRPTAPVMLFRKKLMC
jgi:hypothetical protein